MQAIAIGSLVTSGVEPCPPIPQKSYIQLVVAGCAVLTQKYFDNKVPERGDLQHVDQEVLVALKALPRTISASIEQYRFREATAGLMDLARLGNKYLAETEPWKLYKTDPARVGTILNIALQIAANLSIVGEAFLPFSAQHFSPEEMIGKQVTLIANLEPRQMMGMESQGMVLMAEDENGKLKLIQTSDVVFPGSVVS